MKAKKIYENINVSKSINDILKPKSDNEIKSHLGGLIFFNRKLYNQLKNIFKYEFISYPLPWISFLRETDLIGIYSRHSVAFDDIDLFKKYCPKKEWYNIKENKIYEVLESFDQFLKPKSKKEIDKELKKLTPQHQFNKAVQKGLTYKVKELIDHPEVDPIFSNGLLIYHAVGDENYDILDILLSSEKSKTNPTKAISSIKYLAKYDKELANILLKYGYDLNY